jgi:hypothetical protein
MPSFTLRLHASPGTSAQEAASSFYWLADNSSSFTGGTGPDLEILGPVAPLNADLVRIAAAVLAADQSVRRTGGGSNWNQRRIGLTVPVSAPDAWNSAATGLARVTAFLSGDEWTFTFTGGGLPAPPARTASLSGAPARVVLVSGGADSAVGALYSRSLLTPAEHHVLVSHVGNTLIAPIQERTAGEIQRFIPGPGQRHVSVHLARCHRRIDGTPYPSEPSCRTRSLLFLALGLAVASADPVPLWVPENGFSSLNPPLGPERLGSLSTRTTHPAFLEDLAELLAGIGAHAVIENPFARATKGEMFKKAGELAGTEAAAVFLGGTRSCGLTGMRSFGISVARQCGVCFGCVLRRASFAASGLRDATGYIDPGTDDRVRRWLDSKSVVQQVANFTRRGVTARDIAALGLPASYPVRDALDLCVRGIRELETLHL